MGWEQTTVTSTIRNPTEIMFSEALPKADTTRDSEHQEGLTSGLEMEFATRSQVTSTASSTQ